MPVTEETIARRQARAALKAKFVRKRAVTLPVIRAVKGEEVYIGVLSPMYQGRQVDAKKGPATLMHVIDLASGEEGLFICPAVMVSELEQSYSGKKYVGKGFSVVVTRDAEKNYNHVQIDEVSLADVTLPKIAPEESPASPAAIKAHDDAWQAAQTKRAAEFEAERAKTKR